MEVWKQQKKDGQISDAIESAKSAVKLLPNRLDMRKELARLYMLTKQWDLAEQTLQDVLLIDKVKADTFAMLAELRLIRKQPKQSESKVKKRTPTNAKFFRVAFVIQGIEAQAQSDRRVQLQFGDSNKHALQYSLGPGPFRRRFGKPCG